MDTNSEQHCERSFEINSDSSFQSACESFDSADSFSEKDKTTLSHQTNKLQSHDLKNLKYLKKQHVNVHHTRIELDEIQFDLKDVELANNTNPQHSQVQSEIKLENKINAPQTDLNDFKLSENDLHTYQNENNFTSYVGNLKSSLLTIGDKFNQKIAQSVDNDDQVDTNTSTSWLSASVFSGITKASKNLMGEGAGMIEKIKKSGIDLINTAPISVPTQDSDFSEFVKEVKRKKLVNKDEVDHQIVNKFEALNLNFLIATRLDNLDTFLTSFCDEGGLEAQQCINTIYVKYELAPFDKDINIFTKVNEDLLECYKNTLDSICWDLNDAIDIDLINNEFINIVKTPIETSLTYHQTYITSINISAKLTVLCLKIIYEIILYVSENCEKIFNVQDFVEMIKKLCYCMDRLIRSNLEAVCKYLIDNDVFLFSNFKNVI
ncbi:hypothetical protein A3Q56_01744 [Intoshia linei]|uniref:Uncharacterized protein n=1 Tax=Intoshia linei TaxID=1819745 RepID=A0A177B873_9BILA|nr:hypothetical protein A3Q56_01744 [Intoshia linei]